MQPPFPEMPPARATTCSVRSMLRPALSPLWPPRRTDTDIPAMGGPEAGANLNTPQSVAVDQVGNGFFPCHWSLRVAEAGYLLTTSSNGLNDHQNNLRISSGLLDRFGK